MDEISNNQTINICFAVDDNYAPYLKIALYSLLANRDKSRAYNIMVLHSGLLIQNQNSISAIASDDDNVAFTFIDVSEKEKLIHYDIGPSYLTIATIYRLLLFSELFSEYEKILYLDCDIIVEGDISRLYEMPMTDECALAVEETGFRQMSFSKRAVFINGNQPYNVDNYRTDALHMKHPENYFNAGVLLLNLKKCRECFSFEELISILHEKRYNYNDQDVLNIVLDGKVNLVDYEWNYQNNVDLFLMKRPQIYENIYGEVKRDSPQIIHFVSQNKPWNSEVTLGERYRYYEECCNGRLHT